ncbi:hypothetical protein Q5P01_015787 [Channa striata]|uniref:Fibronectin type-III domain-containing protein n=1 Tax=Channa striata TaxID=64152 RepID=A0AA88SKW4_CHASR|nr:hypothetical protein Q5P01_015787 [Channa striata]
MAGLCSLTILLLLAGIICNIKSDPQNTTSPTDTHSNTTVTKTTKATSSPVLTSNETSPTTSIKSDPQNTTSPADTHSNTTVTITTKGSYTVTPIKFGFKIDIKGSTNGTYNITVSEEGGRVNRRSVDHSANQTSHEIKQLKPCTEYEHHVAFVESDGRETPCNNKKTRAKTLRMSKSDIKVTNCRPGYVCYQSDWDISSVLSSSNHVPPQRCTSDDKTLCIKLGLNDYCSDSPTTFTSGSCSLNLTTSITVDFLNPGDINQSIPTKLPARIDPVFPPNCRNLSIDYTCLDEFNYQKNLSDLEPFTDYSCAVNKHPSGGTCEFTGLKSFTSYTCKVQPTYNNKDVSEPEEVTVKTEAGIPEDITEVTVNVPERNVITVKCKAPLSFNGPVKRYIARLRYGSDTSQVSAFNGKNESSATVKEVSTLYDEISIIRYLVSFIYVATSVGVMLYINKIYGKRKESKYDVNEAVMLETFSGYYTVTPIEFGFQIDITGSTNGTYNINVSEADEPNKLLKNLSDLEPFTNYNCAGQIKENNATIEIFFPFRVDCDLRIIYTKNRKTNTSIELSWDTTSDNCPHVPELKNLHYYCSCTGTKPKGAHEFNDQKILSDLEPFTDYNCTDEFTDQKILSDLEPLTDYNCADTSSPALTSNETSPTTSIKSDPQNTTSPTDTNPNSTVTNKDTSSPALTSNETSPTTSIKTDPQITASPADTHSNTTETITTKDTSSPALTSNETSPTTSIKSDPQNTTSPTDTHSNTTVTITTKGSYTVTPIKFGFKIDITGSTNGNYSITVTEEVGRVNRSSVDHSANQTSHEIKPLKPCTEYEHHVAFIESDGSETSCNNKTKEKTLGMNFLNPKDKHQPFLHKLPAQKNPTFLSNCKNLSTDFTCLDEPNKLPKILSDLEPFTDYSCTGQIKENNATIEIVFSFRVDCDLKINYTKKRKTNTSIELSWNTTSQKCTDASVLKNIYYDCSCTGTKPKGAFQQKKVTAKKLPSGGTCHFTELHPFTSYTCKVQPTYNKQNVPEPRDVTVETQIGIPETVTNVRVEVIDHNVITVKCNKNHPSYRFNGPENTYIARLSSGSESPHKLSNKTCDFIFRDLSYSTTFKLELTAFNGYFESRSWTAEVSTLYDEISIIRYLVSFIYVATSVGVMLYINKIYGKRKESKYDVNEAVMLETFSDELNDPKKLSDLEPFTDYNCADLAIIYTKKSTTNTSIELSWDTISANCADVPELKNLHYDCSCTYSNQKGTNELNESKTLSDLEPFTDYNCTDELNDQKILSDLEPFTDYNCTDELNEPKNLSDLELFTNYNCTDLTTTFTSGSCSLNLTTSITVDFLNPGDINQSIPTKLPARIDPVFPPNCRELSIDYTCLDEFNDQKNLSDLEPFTDYSCTGQIKENGVDTNKRTSVRFRVDCGTLMFSSPQSMINLFPQMLQSEE